MFLDNSYVRMTIQECEESDAVLEILAQSLKRAIGDIKASVLFTIT
jgi:histidinol-phosphate/aromatic aminotransferase/cobyric acid decarboxylase-like protein